MKQFTRRVRRNGRAFFDLRLIIASVGLFLSIALHELFHIIVHWGHITQIRFFSNHGAIMEMTSLTDHSYNPQLEEAIAYGITMLVMLATAVALWYVHDKKDTRTFTQIVFPNNQAMQHLSHRELLELATRINLL